MFRTLGVVMIAIPFGIAALGLMPVHAHAQTLSDLKQALVLQQQQLDRLQLVANATLGAQNIAGYLDWAVPGPMSTLALGGWVLQCGQTRPRVQVKIDGVVMDDIAVAPYTRTDVTEALGPYCAQFGGLLPDIGAAAFLDLTNYAPGDHTIALHIIAANGYTLDTNTLTFTR